MLVVHVFETLVIAHILSGLVGLIALWIPIATKKGGRLHRKAGAVFVKSMLVTGTVAIGIATSTLIAPVETHPHLLDHPLFVGGAETIRAIFGWMATGASRTRLRVGGGPGIRSHKLCCSCCR